MLIDKVELLVKRMRWKALFFENESESIFNYGFKTNKCPPQKKDLMEFEDDLQKKISIVQFRKVNNDFQNRLKKDIRSIQLSARVFVFADKTKKHVRNAKITLQKTSD